MPIKELSKAFGYISVDMLLLIYSMFRPWYMFL